MLSDIKYVAFDFDDTLCIHTNHRHGTAEENLTQNVECLLGTCKFDDGRVSTPIQQFMLRLKGKGATMGLISATTFGTRALAKIDWVRENYGVELQHICVAEPSDKVEMLKYIAKAYNLQNHQILIVDDFYAVLESAADAGFAAMSPVECVEAVLREEL